MKGDGKVIFWAIFLSIISMVGIIGFGILIAIYINTGADSSRLFSDNLSYEVMRKPEDIPVTREKPETIDISQLYSLRNLLETQKFDALNTILDEYQNLFILDNTNEYKVSDAFEVFKTTYPEYEELLLTWISDYPDCYQPYIAIAEYYYAKGWESRGNKYANETSDEQFRVMQEYFIKAEKNANEALLINPNLMVAYEILIGISNAGTTEKSEDQLIMEALELFPYSFNIWATASWAKQPRWGGSYKQMEQIAKAAEKYIGRNQRLSVLYGLIYHDQSRYFLHDEKYDNAMKLIEKARDYGDYRPFYYDLAEIYYYDQQNYDLALGPITKAIQLRPTFCENYILRSKIFFKKRMYEESLDNLRIAEIIDPGNSFLQNTKKWECIELVNEGIDHFKSDPKVAIEYYNMAIQFDDKNFEPYYRKSYAYYSLKNVESALSNAITAAELNPRHFESYRLIDYCLMQSRDWATIIKYWNYFLELEPNHAEAYFERSGTYYHNKDMEHALADLKKACELGHEEACNMYQQFAGK